MNLPKQIAKQFRGVYFGGNWTSVSLKESLSDVDWELATTKTQSLNTIASLVYHTGYYVHSVLKVLEGNPLDAHDKYSFDMPQIAYGTDWENLLNKTWMDAEIFAGLIDQLPENKLWENFSEEKFGNYYCNIHGIIEHTHYHLGQIVLIKKILSQNRANLK